MSVSPAPTLTQQREEALALYAQHTSLADMRALAKGDLFYLLAVVMKRKDINRDWLFARCREVQAAPDGHLDLWARGHYKSTIITVGKTIQDVLNNPEITVGIFSHTKTIARDFLKQIKYEFENNKQLYELFPHIAKPEGTDSRTWSEAAIVVQRSTNPKEATIEGWGLIEGQPTGKHFSLLVYDDVVTRESVYTPEQMKKTTEAWELSQNLGDEGGRMRLIGTRYHFNDTYKAILDKGVAVPRVYPATVDGTPDGAPVLLSRAALRRKRTSQGPYTFGCQMLQNPIADSVMGFKREWLRYADVGGNWRMPHAGHNLYMLCDPAAGKKKNNDYTVMVVIGLAADGNYYVIDGLRDRLNLTERAAALFRLHQQYHPLAVGYEQYGMQADIEYIKTEMETRNYRFGITPLGGGMPKNDRIRRLIPLFEGGKVWLPSTLPFVDSEKRQRDFTKEFIEEEYTAFPVAGHDDMLDCVARIVEPAMAATFPMAQALLGSGGQQYAINNYNPYD